MRLSEFKRILATLDTLTFVQPNGKVVPGHFHITEVGLTTKNFIDCGGTVRKEEAVNFQLWEANDTDHRLTCGKLMKIIDLSENVLTLGDLEVEVEYQTDTIGRYGLAFDGKHFLLTAKRTDCLAKDNCGVPKEKVKLADLGKAEEGCCGSSNNCCN